MTLLVDDQSITTERLLLRRFTPDDLDFLVALHSSELVTRYIGHGRPRSYDESQQWLAQVLQQYNEHELGQLAVVRLADDKLIGRCGLWALYLECDPLPNQRRQAWFGKEQVPDGCAARMLPELGYTFDAAYWGQSYASEAVQGVLSYLRLNRHFDDMVSLIHPDNLRSLRIADKFNLQRQGEVECFGQLLSLYRWPVANKN